MLAGNIADFARSVRTFSDPAPALSGNQGNRAASERAAWLRVEVAAKRNEQCEEY